MASKLVVERAHLVAALTAVTKAVETRNTIPILANVHLSQDGERLALRTTDLVIEIATHIEASGTLPTTTTNARTLLDIVKKFPAGAEVTLEIDGETLTVKSGRSRFKLATLPEDSFPAPSTADFGLDFDVDLAALFAPVRFAISAEETRHYLNGIYLFGDGARLTAVATDGHRLAKHVTDLPVTTSAIIVPTKTVNIVPQGKVSLAVAADKVRITQGDTTIVSKLVEGTYPDYERVIPKNNDLLVVADRGALLAAVDRVGTIATPMSGKVVKLEVGEGAVTLSVQGDTGAASDEVATEYAGNPIITGMSTRYLQDILGAITGPTVTMAFAAELGPVLLRGDNDNWIGVQMPMRVA